MTIENGFQKYGIERLTPTMISNWDNAPATLILRRVFGIKGKANAKMWRGDGVEAGAAHFMRFGDLEEATNVALSTFWDRAAGEVDEETEKEAAIIPGMVEQFADHTGNASYPPHPTSQLSIEHWFDGIPAPFFGKMDFVFDDGRSIELKTTERCPSKIESASLSHRWQAALYATARNAPVILLYVTPKKWAAFDVQPGDDCLKTLVQTTKAMNRLLASHDDGRDLLESLPLTADSFYWDDDLIAAYERAVEGEIPPLKGTGTDGLAAQGVVTFGKHAGKHISELPATYLNWLLNPTLSSGDVFDVPEPLQDAIRAMREDAA